MISLLVTIVTLVLSTYYIGLGTDNKETLGTKTEINTGTSTPSPITPNFLKPTDSQEPISTSTPEPTSSTTPSQVNTTSIDEWIYPGASVTSKSGASLSLETREDTKVVTDWYEGKIRSGGFNVKSFVTTKTNDNVLNKLSGAKSGQEVAIEIKKAPGEANTKVTVTLD